MIKNRSLYKSKDKIPPRYLEGLNSKEKALMTKEILAGVNSLKYWSGDKAYAKRLKKEKNQIPKSSYTLAYHRKYGKENTGSLSKISKATGIRLSILKEVYKRGHKAWISGHRPGVYPQQWSLARVYSFVMGGKTRKTADKDLWELHLKDLKKKRRKNPRDEGLLKQLKISKQKYNNQIYYEVYLKNILIGYAFYDPRTTSVSIVRTELPFQRKGVANWLYDYIEKDQNIKLSPDHLGQTQDGELFWKSRLKKNPKNQSLLNRITLPYDKQGHVYYYDIMLDGTKNIGTVRYDSLKNEQDIIIDEPYQKQGIGTLVYDTIEKQFGVKLKPSNSLSYDGIEFWKKRKQ